MYLNNPKKLFDDLYHIGTMNGYMDAVYDDGNSENLKELISVTEYNIDCATSGDSTRWEKYDSTFDLDTLIHSTKEIAERIAYNKQIDEDFRTLKRIYKTIQKELNSKYVMFCDSCGATVFYSRKPKYDPENYYCYKCKNETLTLLPLHDWLKLKNIELV